MVIKSVTEKLRNMANNPFCEDEGACLEAITEIERLTLERDKTEAIELANGGHWGESNDFPVNDWVQEVRDGSTRQGYWEWVLNQKEMQP